jgi:sulfur carrier protein
MLLSPLSMLKRKAIRRGLMGGSNGWLLVGVVMYLPRVAKVVRPSGAGGRHRATAAGAVRAHRCGTPAHAGRASGGPPWWSSLMKVLLRNPRREMQVEGRRSVHALLKELDLPRESHLVIRNGTLVPGDAELGDDDVVEIRPVISGGC